MRTSVPTAGARAQYLMSDRPARRPASGRCCGGARGGASAPAPARAAPRRRGAALSPRAPVLAARRGATGGSRCYAVRTLTNKPLARADPGSATRGAQAPRSTRPGASWHSAPAGGRRRPGPSTWSASPSASPAVAGDGSNRTRSKRFLRRPPLRARGGALDRRICYFQHIQIAPFLLRSGLLAGQGRQGSRASACAPLLPCRAKTRQLPG